LFQLCGVREGSNRCDPIRVSRTFFSHPNSHSAHAKVYNDAMKEIDLRKWLMVLFFSEDVPEFLIEIITAVRNPKQVWTDMHKCTQHEATHIRTQDL
jgi:hypothetical protein